MRLRAALQAAALLTAAFWTHPLLAESDDPTFKSTKLDHYPYNLNYFEDSDVVLYQDEHKGTIFRSEDAGASWKLVQDIPEGKAFQLVMHPYDHKRAYVLTTSGVHHFRTHDQGKTWKTFFADTEMSIFRHDILSFHASDPDRIIFNGMDCKDIIQCEEVTMYTLDGFNSDAKYLRGSTSGCWWAKSSELFTTGQDDLNTKRILCIVRDQFSPLKQDQRLLISDNYFSSLDSSGVIQEFEPNLDMTRPIQGVVNVAVIKKYLLVATTAKNTDEMSLFVSDDSIKWHRAVFPTDHKLNQEAYTVLESTNYSIQVDVMTTHPSNPMGVIYTSNSNGTFFTRNIEHTNRNRLGHVDFEKITGVQGIFMVNKVENAQEIEKDRRGKKKKIVSEITFDDGRTFEPIHADKERLHLHSVTELNNAGRVFSSPAPGLVMGNGNTGSHLESYGDASLYISDDAGLTWMKGPNGPHKYEFGDQGSVLLAVRQADEVNEVTYSLNHGKDWKKAKLPDDLKIKPIILTTTQDSTSLKFILIGEGKSRNEFHIVAIDFGSMHEATCKDSDMEDWFARVDDKGNPTCIMGHTQKYRRRKKDADCFLKQEFKDPVPEKTDCECSDQDFECDYNFKRDGESCVPVGVIAAPDGACKNAGPDDTFKGSSGWRLIPGNTCKRASGAQKDDRVDRKCKEASEPTPSKPTGKIGTTLHDFKGEWADFQKHYLEKGEDSSDVNEVIIARPFKPTEAGDIMLTKDHGKHWDTPDALKGKKIQYIMTHHYFKEMAFFIQPSGKVTYTVDHGDHFHNFEAPTELDPKARPLEFHPDHKDWLIWIGQKCENKECYREASFSRDRGDHWTSIQRYVDKCVFTGSSSYNFRSKDQIVCSTKSREGNENNIPYNLMSSNDLSTTWEVRQKNVKDFATMAEFIVVATEDTEKKSLKAFTSLDGEKFAAARFPYNLDVKEEPAFTVLDSSTHAVNLFVPARTSTDRCFGTIVKSNSNATEYVVSIAGVNCDHGFYVDFERMYTLEGVIIVNVVANRENKNEPKKKRTLISHSDGATWSYLPPPRVDAENKNYPCTSSDNGDENCALHIHGYTERKDPGKTYSSAGAVGLMFGVGNVGPTLGDIKDADTFLTRDAGISWKSVKKGVWRWAYGDQGSILLLVPRVKTKMVSYTTDEGKTWNDYDFNEEAVEVLDMTTVSSGSSRNFLLWCRKSDGALFTVNLDFSGLTNKPCKQVDDSESESDYYVWSPSHPLREDDCLFGHKSYYLRKKTDRQCFNEHKIARIFKTEVCDCTREDFECDYNYELDGVGRNCVLAKGVKPMSREDWCSAHPKEPTWYEPSGFRKIPLSTCQGGRIFDNYTTPYPCPGHEEEYERLHGGPGGFTIFLIVVLCIGAAGAVGFWVHRRWESGGFGQIRLGEQHSGTSFLDPESPWVRYPVMAVSATVALVGALPLLAGALWRTTKTTVERWGIFGGAGRGTYGSLGLGSGSGSRRFTTRDSFARGRSDYAGIDEDEGELLGDDSDEEV